MIGTVVAPTALAKPSSKCQPGPEQAGCTLPVDAIYSKQVRKGSAKGYVTVNVTSRGVSVIVYDVYIECKKFDPSNGDESGIAANYQGKQHPKVGKTYTIKDSASENDEEGRPATTDSELALNFKSAKQMVLTLHQVSTYDGKLMCDGSGTWMLKRQ